MARSHSSYRKELQTDKRQQLQNDILFYCREEECFDEVNQIRTDMHFTCRQAYSQSTQFCGGVASDSPFIHKALFAELVEFSFTLKVA